MLDGKGGVTTRVVAVTVLAKDSDMPASALVF